MAINTSAILEKARELKAQLQEQLKSEMTKIFPAFWEQNPDIKSIVWTQYAPYFNDGDPCIFSVREVAFTNIEDINLIQGNSYQIIYWDDHKEDELSSELGVDASTLFAISEYHAEKDIKKKYINANASDIKDMTTFLGSDVMSDIMMATFGSDALVIATRDGFHTTEFNHD